MLVKSIQGTFSHSHEGRSKEKQNYQISGLQIKSISLIIPFFCGKLTSALPENRFRKLLANFVLLIFKKL